MNAQDKELEALRLMADFIVRRQGHELERPAFRTAREIVNVFKAYGARIVDQGNRPLIHAWYARFAEYFRLALNGRLAIAFSLDEACELYDLLYFMRWRSIECPDDLTAFNPEVVEPFVALVASRGGWDSGIGGRTGGSGRSPIQLAYLAAWTNLWSSNACARVTWTYIRGHQALRRGGPPVLLYCLEPPEKDLAQSAAEAGVVIRQVGHDGTNTGKARAVLAQARADGIDGLMIDTPNALATLLFAARAAPAQGYIEMGFDVWRGANVDFCFTCEGRWTEIVSSAERNAQLAIISHMDFLAPERPRASVDELRRRFAVLPGGAPPSVAYGFYGRMPKVTAGWLDLMEQVLTKVPTAVCYLGGAGGLNPDVDTFLARSPAANRFVYEPRFVDGHVAGRAIDVFVDTFPFPGGLSCLECQAKGVPVLWLASQIGDPRANSHQMQHVLVEYRDPELKAGDAEAFVRLGVELADPGRRARARDRAIAIARKFSDGEPGAAQIERSLGALIRS